MTSVVESRSPDHTRQIRQVQVFTIVWMLVEAVVSLFSAWRARSPALLAFGGDSVIELASAVVVLGRFRSGSACETKDCRVARIAGALLFVLAAYVVMVSAVSLLGYGEPRPSVTGIIILLSAAIVMPLLVREKRKLSSVTGSTVLRADAAESAVCAYLSVVALRGVGVNTVWHFSGADPVAALMIVPLIVWEGREAMRGKPCGWHRKSDLRCIHRNEDGGMNPTFAEPNVRSAF
jgi:divalent metal cation (Fe/Co/Zn/Cd) transporter